MNKTDFLFNSLYEMIRDGELGDGAMIGTEEELAKRFDCSRITVRAGLRKLEELKLIRRIRGNGTYVQSRRIRFFSRRNIGLVVHDTRKCFTGEYGPFFSQLMYELIQNDKHRDFSANFIIQNFQDRDFCAALARHRLALGDFDGFIFGKELSAEETVILERNRSNYIALQASHAPSCCPYITCDNLNGTYLAARHLLERGRRNLVFLHGTEDNTVTRDRLRGYFRALEEFDLRSPVQTRHYEITESETAELTAADTIRRLLTEEQPLDAVISTGDWMTLGTVKALRETGRRIPEDVALLMYDDVTTVHRITGLNITAVRQPFHELLGAVLDVLLEHTDDFPLPCCQLLPAFQPVLLVRETT